MASLGGPLAAFVLTEGMANVERDEILRVARDRSVARRELNFNAFDVVLDFKRGTATLIDEVFEHDAETLPLDRFLDAVRHFEQRWP